jgi:hypothetical protein
MGRVCTSAIPFHSIPFLCGLALSAAVSCETDTVGHCTEELCAIGRRMCCSCTLSVNCCSQVQAEGLVEARWLLGRAGRPMPAVATSASGLAHIHRCIAAQRIASQRSASHRIASQRSASGPRLTRAACSKAHTTAKEKRGSVRASGETTATGIGSGYCVGSELHRDHTGRDARVQLPDGRPHDHPVHHRVGQARRSRRTL